MTGDEQAEYNAWLGGLTATPTLAEFRRWSRYDPNLVWRLKSGDMVNLLEDAIEQLDAQTALGSALYDAERASHERTIAELAELAARINAIHQALARSYYNPAKQVRDIRAILDRPFPKKE